VSPIPEKKPVPEELTARLQAAGIWQMVNAAYYGVFVREGCLVVAQRNPDTGAYTSIGSSGYPLEGVGVAFLQWQGDQPFLYHKDCGAVPATPEQLATLRKFSADVKAALGLEEAASA
jgi:hypothetical protein